MGVRAHCTAATTGCPTPKVYMAAPTTININKLIRFLLIAFTNYASLLRLILPNF
jgi:hypothetical protein